ncbi:MAG: DUF664 domain-containing protein [Propionibacteriaceae bacterium]|nr:DUF664 domain-containing protein [Propionibacteriaceae bacterium]
MAPPDPAVEAGRADRSATRDPFDPELEPDPARDRAAHGPGGARLVAAAGGRRGRAAPVHRRRRVERARRGPRRGDYQQLLDEWPLVDAVAARYDLDHLFDHGGGTMSVRTLYLHLIEEWARHNGDADLLREAIDGVTGE